MSGFGSFYGMGDAASECLRLKESTVPCTPEELAAYATWKASNDADIARAKAQEAYSPSTIIIGATGWITPDRQIQALTGGGLPFLYYVGAALPLILLWMLFSGGKR